MKKTIFILYSLFLVSLTVFSYAFVDPNLIYLKNIYTGFAFDKKIETSIIYVFFISLSFIFYFLFLSLLKKNKLNLKNIKVLIGVTVGILFLSYSAMLSYDIFNYLTTAKVLFFYHENPYLVMPIEFQLEPFLSFTRAANKIALYGPFWEILSGIPYLIGSNNFLITLFSFKLFIILFYIGTVFLIFKISRNIFSTLFFALNPLVVWETLVNSHNDIVMMFFALLSFYIICHAEFISASQKLHVSKVKILLSIIFFILSIFIKYSTLFLIPIFLYVMVKTILNHKINWEKTFYFSALLMILVFLLSPIREEIYSWYAVWFLTFSFLVSRKKFLLNLSLVFSFTLLLRYVPFLYSGTYIGKTPIIKEIVTFTPPIFYSFYYVLKKKI